MHGKEWRAIHSQANCRSTVGPGHPQSAWVHSWPRTVGAVASAAASNDEPGRSSDRADKTDDRASRTSGGSAAAGTAAASSAASTPACRRDLAIPPAIRAHPARQIRAYKPLCAVPPANPPNHDLPDYERLGTPKETPSKPNSHRRWEDRSRRVIPMV